MRVAMYLRLSSEDGDLKDTGKAESESISNQRGLIENFIRSRSEFSGWEICEFCDDGWSGKNFDRPSFLKMMEQVKQGQINCIVVKDLSRFGRDYLVVGNYISRVFPFMGVRFIAINDSFDSSRPQDIDSLDTSFKTLIYDLYSRELSAKVKSAKRIRAEKGLFLSPFAPYGYVKAPDDKNRLLIDEEAAKIVRMVFTMTADGMKPVEIASMLNREDVPTPMLHKRAAGCSRDRWPSVHEENFWTTAMICKILRDERYLGKCVYGKRERDMVGNVHTLKHKKEDCESSGKRYCVCRRHAHNAEACNMPPIPEDAIMQAFLRLYDNLKHGEILQFTQKTLSTIRNRKMLWSTDIVELNQRISDLSSQSHKLSALNRRGMVDPDIFISKSNQLAELLRNAKQKKEKILQQEDRSILDSTEQLLETIEAGPEVLEAFDEELFCELIDKIIVESNVRIRFRLKNGLELPETIERTVR